MTETERELCNAVSELLSNYTLKLGGVLDADRKMIHWVNAGDVSRLSRAYHQMGVCND